MATTWTATLWYDDIEPVDHSALGLARLIWQYRGDQPRVQAWLEAFLDQVDSVEGMAFDVYTGLWPLTAVGAQLTTLGKIVGQPRGTLVDDEYRIFILGRIFVNRGDGQLPQFYELLEILGVTEDIRAYEFRPAALEISSSQIDYPDTVGDLLGDLSAGGVTLDFVHSVSLDADIFETADTLGADQLDVARGLENLAGTTGGRLPGHRRY